MLTGMSITEVGCFGSGTVLATIEGAGGCIDLQEKRKTAIPNKVIDLIIEADVFQVLSLKYFGDLQNELQLNLTFSLNGTRKITGFNLSKLIRNLQIFEDKNSESQFRFYSN